MPTRYDPRRVDELITQLAEIRRSLLDAEHEHLEDLAGIPVRELPSACNLLHYIALRRFDLRPLQARLAAFGLSSLGRCEAHVLASIDAVLAMLHRLAGHDWSLPRPPEPMPVEPGANRDLERAAVDLLGPARDGRPVRIMATLPVEAAYDATVARDLIAAGMDVARINAALDDLDTWTAMARHVRAAAATAGTSCRILFDLAGPKLRTASFGDGARVLRIKPRRDARGLVQEVARVRLGPPLIEHGALPAVPVDGLAALAAASPGDRIEVDEPQGRTRSLSVEARADDELVCTTERSVRFETGAELRLCRGDQLLASARVGSLPPRPERMLLQHGDELLVGDAELPVLAPPRDLHGNRLGPGQLPSTLDAALLQIKVGDPIWFDDGRIGGVVTAVLDHRLRVRIDAVPQGGARLGPDKGINLPKTHLDLPRPTAQDIADLDFAVAHADMVGFSFVEQPQDVLRLEDLLTERGASHLGIVLKIETRRAFEALPQLLLTGLRSPPLGVMVARGDLAVEVGFARLAEVQEQILWLCEAAHVPVFWATQVMETLAKTGMPTRSEVSDAAMAVRAECVMLNKGPFQVEAMRMLDDVLRRMQHHHSKKRSMLRRLSSFDG